MYVLKPTQFRTKESIERDTEQILARSQHKLNTEFLHPPIPVDKIAEFVFDLTIEWVENIETSDEGNVLGQIIPNEKLIQINASILQTDHQRLNFTIAHELGHFCMHFQYIEQDIATNIHKLFDSNHVNSINNAIEWQAEYFASALLAPRKMVLNLAEKKRKTWANIYNMARRFRISPTAMNVRLEKMVQSRYLFIDENGIMYRNEGEANGQLRLL